ncbi:MAG: DUF4258 domain-containing protein [Hydrogenibacillus schlegelii]|uniref:DUF4258 domain-containing protein n=1 Tax=Hydrogenibacillus schlegelii TaxID=1484 RepID=A0A947CWN0_HYDSH|nr:DUF4258 domain-containing protein [Hydrogenibacillus schlegelii]
MDRNEIIKQFRPAIRKAIKSGRVAYSKHAREMMKLRGITRKDVLEILTQNEPHEYFPANQYPYGEKPFSNPDPLFTVMGKCNIVVVIAVQWKKHGTIYKVVTTFFAGEQSRHRKRKSPPSVDP